MLRHLTLKREYFYYALLFILSIGAYIIYKGTLSYPFFIFDDYHHYTFSLTKGQEPLIDLIRIHRTAMPFFYKVWNLILSFVTVPYHLIALRTVNILLHLTNAIFLFFIIDKVGAKESAKPEKSHIISFFTVLLFFFHPLQVESTLWVSSMKGVLATTLTLLSWLLLLSKNNLITYILSLLSFSFALMCKVTLGPAAIVFFLLGSKDTFKNTLSQLLPFLTISSFFVFYQVWTYHPGIEHHIAWYITHTIFQFKYYFITLTLLSIFASVYIRKKQITLLKWRRPLTLAALFILAAPWLTYFSFIAAKVKAVLYVFYYSLYQSLLPLKYVFDHGINSLFLTNYVSNFHTAALFIATCLILYQLYKRNLYFFKIFLAILLLSLPHLGLVEFSFAKSSYYADRFMYLPLAFISLLFAEVVFKIEIKLKIKIKNLYGHIAFITMCVCLLLPLSLQRQKLWQTNDTLLQDSLKKNPFSLITMMSLAHHYEKQNLFYQAMSVYHQVSMKYPDLKDAYTNRLRLLIEMKQYDQAISYANDVMNRFRNFSPDLFKYLGQSYYLKKEYKRALLYYNKYLEINPGNKSLKALTQHLNKLVLQEKSEQN